MFPVALALAVIAMNAGLFLSECAAFDRIACDAIRAEATSPPFGEGLGDACARVKETIEGDFARDFLSVEVESEPADGRMVAYSATLRFVPTLFGLGFKSEVFGVALPSLSHTVSLTVDPYRPGVLL